MYDICKLIVVVQEVVEKAESSVRMNLLCKSISLVFLFVCQVIRHVFRRRVSFNRFRPLQVE
jgi:hypothetical protein